MKCLMAKNGPAEGRGGTGEGNRVKVQVPAVREGDRGPGLLNFIKRMAGKMSADALGTEVGGGEVPFHPPPPPFPMRINEETVKDFGVEIALAIEIAVKAPGVEARARHDLLDGDTL